jgi:hypothetical protein
MWILPELQRRLPFIAPTTIQREDSDFFFYYFCKTITHSTLIANGVLKSPLHCDGRACMKTTTETGRARLTSTSLRKVIVPTENPLTESLGPCLVTRVDRKPEAMQCCGSEIWCFFWTMGSGMNIPDYFSQSLENVFRVKNT